MGKPEWESLRDELLELDSGISQALIEMQETLSSMKLGVPIELGFFTWQKHKGEWALWFQDGEDWYRPSSTSRQNRAEFLAWVGSDLEEIVCNQLRKIIAKRKQLLERDLD